MSQDNITIFVQWSRECRWCNNIQNVSRQTPWSL